MAEINNNINKFGYIENKVVDKSKNKPVEPPSVDAGEKEPTVYAKDTGVLGRSLVKKSANGANIAKTIEETVAMSKKPEIMGCSEGVFESAYNTFVEQGMKESDAYTRALLVEEEFMDICSARK